MQQLKKIAIVGAGLAGLGVACALMDRKKVQVTLFDGQGVGQGASKYALGIFNLFAGARMRLNPWGYDPLIETYELFLEAQKHSQKKIILRRGLIKIATTHDQKQDFSLAAQMYPEIIPMSKPNCYYIATALTIDTRAYMEGLYRSLFSRGLQFQKRSIQSLKELEEYDRVVICAGIESCHFEELASFKLRPVKGQILRGQLKSPLRFPLSSKVHIVPQEGHQYVLGATYEHYPETHFEQMQVAMQKIIPKLMEFYPEFDLSTIENCEAGIRATTKDHYPIVEKLNNRLFIFTGLGSKGLLCHAVLGSQLVQSMYI